MPEAGILLASSVTTLSTFKKKVVTFVEVGAEGV